MKTLILASSSPYRKAILERLGIPFIAEAPEIDESQLEGESAEALVTRLALEKASVVAKHHSNALIIGSDQVAALGDRILGKPGNHLNSVSQLTELSGKSVCFQTGLCLFNSDTGQSQLALVPFWVHFRTLPAELIEAYLQKEKPYNCAGSFKSEGLGSVLFERLEGSDPTALIGLPLIQLVRFLEVEKFPIL